MYAGLATTQKNSAILQVTGKDIICTCFVDGAAGSGECLCNSFGIFAGKANAVDTHGLFVAGEVSSGNGISEYLKGGIIFCKTGQKDVVAYNVDTWYTDDLLLIAALVILEFAKVDTTKYITIKTAEHFPIGADDVYVDKLDGSGCIAAAQFLFGHQAEKAAGCLGICTQRLLRRERNMEFNHITLRVLAINARVVFGIFHGGVDAAAALEKLLHCSFNIFRFIAGVSKAGIIDARCIALISVNKTKHRTAAFFKAGRCKADSFFSAKPALVLARSESDGLDIKISQRSRIFRAYLNIGKSSFLHNVTLNQ